MKVNIKVVTVFRHKELKVVKLLILNNVIHFITSITCITITYGFPFRFLCFIIKQQKQATLRPNRTNAEGYFLAGGTVMWLQVGHVLNILTSGKKKTRNIIRVHVLKAILYQIQSELYSIQLH